MNLQLGKIVIYILVIILLTPWYWQLNIQSQEFFKLEFKEDIQKARQNVEWLKSKTKDNLLEFLFINWPTLFIQERLGIVMESLDIGNYFFSGHPRERVGVSEKQKFFLFQFILLLLGIFSKEVKSYTRNLLILFLILLTLTFLFKWRDFNQTFLLSIPFIFIMSLGLKELIFKRRYLFIALSLLASFEILFFILINVTK